MKEKVVLLCDLGEKASLYLPAAESLQGFIKLYFPARHGDEDKSSTASSTCSDTRPDRDESSPAFNSLYLHLNVCQLRVCLFLNEELDQQQVIISEEQSGTRPQESAL